MKPKTNPFRELLLLLVATLCVINTGFSQNCSALTAGYIVTESRCTATGTLKINASGGSGSYNYKLDGTSASDFTSSNLITGLAPGIYSVTIKDIVSNCIFQIDNIIITGTYSDPRFGLAETDVTCMNGNDGTVSVNGLTNGRAPFVFSLVAPSAMGIGTTNSTGTFTGLIPGSYSVQLMDSCGGIQTRNITVQNYNWSISSSTVTQINCTGYDVTIGLTDSKGRTNASGTAFNGFTYGYVNAPGDTVWFSSANFNIDLGQKRNLVLVAKDNCGLVQTKSWKNTLVPSVQANILINGNNCTGFNATVTGQQNLTSPVFCLTDNLGNAVTGQPCNTTGVFTGVPYGSYCIQITNTCYDTVITRCFSQAQAVPSVSGTVSLSNYTCTHFDAAVTGQQNLTSPQYCLLDGSGNPVSGVACNTTGVFPNLPFGSYSIKVTDGCTGTVLTLNFSASEKIKSVAATITTSQFTCTDFDAAITGQTNLNSPQYCLVDNLGNPITCNTTGVFTNLAYGNYCVNITDACNDTTIQRCMTVTKPSPSGGSASVTNKTCSGFTVTISGQSNMFNGLYCLQDSAGDPVSGIPCNTTGVFNNVPYGSYCVKTTDGCSGTVLTNCFSVSAPAPAVGPVAISNASCSGFTAKITGQQNLTSPVYCLYDSLGNPVGACNATGIFAITGFGSYYINTTDGCVDTTFRSDFVLYKPVPSVGPLVNFTDQSCTTFTATITGQQNLSNAIYYLKDSDGNAINNNNTGVFANLAYGSYCIDIVNDCADTTIVRCFSLAPNPTQMVLTATPSCLFNASDLSIQVTAGFAPYTASVFNQADSLIADTVTGNPQINISGLPALLPGDQYKIVVNGTCGTPATQYLTGQQSSLSHVYTITPRCPSSITPVGSGDLDVVAATNLGTLNMIILQKNGVPDTVGYSFRTGNHFTFNNLEAAVYVVAYSFSGCTTVVNDTITIPNYNFPLLAPSGAYQCDNNNFSVGAVVSGGMAPYAYQIIGSVPATPSINSPTQSSPIFTISNGEQYSLVRLRAIDACGNATLNDVSILPLANTIVTATSNCIYKATTLTTDVVANAIYTWYKKTDINATDSVIIGTGPSYSIPAISVADTGIYINRMSVNSGCLTKISYFHLDGMCDGMFLLSSSVKLSGKIAGAGINQLSWNIPTGTDVYQYQVERLNPSNGQYMTIGTVSGSVTPAGAGYTDYVSGDGSFYYRLKIMNTGGLFVYSNILQLKQTDIGEINVFPNPVTDGFRVQFPKNKGQQYGFRLFNVSGQEVYARQQFIPQNGVMTYTRTTVMPAGVYFLHVSDAGNNTVQVFKLIFR